MGGDAPVEGAGVEAHVLPGEVAEQEAAGGELAHPAAAAAPNVGQQLGQEGACVQVGRWGGCGGTVVDEVAVGVRPVGLCGIVPLMATKVLNFLQKLLLLGYDTVKKTG